MKLQFFTTMGCHLCEQAEAIIAEVKNSRHQTLEIEAIDIADHDDLFELYGIRIPVVKFPDSEADLGWPFTQTELISYLDGSPCC